MAALGICLLPVGRPLAEPVQTPAAEAQGRGQQLAALGRVLFRSADLSADGSVSCSTCHVPQLGFSGAQAVATGVNGYTAGRHAPGLLGMRAGGPFMWDGRAASLSEQIPMPLESPEMSVDWPRSLRALNADPHLLPLAKVAGLEHLDRGTVIKSIAAYLTTLEAGSSRFDRYYYGHDESALSVQEAWGLRLFVRKGGCSTCHLLNAAAAPLTDGAFHATGIGFAGGMQPDPGRARVTGEAADMGRFKTPGLRNVALRRFFMHDGSLTTLDAVVQHYNEGGRRDAPNLDPRLRPLHLDQAEVGAIVAFLGALTSEGVGTGF